MRCYKTKYFLGKWRQRITTCFDRSEKQEKKSDMVISLFLCSGRTTSSARRTADMFNLLSRGFRWACDLQH